MAAEFKGTNLIVLTGFTNKRVVVGDRTAGSITGTTYDKTVAEGTKVLGVSTKVPAGDDFVFGSYDTYHLKKGNKSGNSIAS